MISRVAFQRLASFLAKPPTIVVDQDRNSFSNSLSRSFENGENVVDSFIYNNDSDDDDDDDDDNDDDDNNEDHDNDDANLNVGNENNLNNDGFTIDVSLNFFQVFFSHHNIYMYNI